jgi:hypothetical protein
MRGALFAVCMLACATLTSCADCPKIKSCDGSVVAGHIFDILGSHLGGVDATVTFSPGDERGVVRPESSDEALGVYAPADLSGMVKVTVGSGGCSASCSITVMPATP